MVKRMDLCASRYAACVDAVGASIVCNIRAHLQAPAMQAILPTLLMTAMQSRRCLLGHCRHCTLFGLWVGECLGSSDPGF